MYQLKIKALSLAEEARIIKSEEDREKHLIRKWKEKARIAAFKAARTGKPIDVSRPEPKSTALTGLHLHRVNKVRKEARNACLAYGFLLGRSYVEMENFAWTQPDWDRVQTLVVRYGGVSPQEAAQRFAQWKDEALGGLIPSFFKSSIQPGSVKEESLDYFGQRWVEMQRERNRAEVTTTAVVG